MERGNRRLQYLSAVAVSTGATTGGVAFSWPAPVVAKFYNNETGFNLTEAEISWVVAISSLGFMMGSLAARFTSDRYGRRATLLGSGSPFEVGMILQLLAQDAWTLCFSRFLVGTGSGMAASVSSIYIAEISDKDLRGSLILGNRSLFSFGCLLTMAIGPSMTYRTINYSMALLPICYATACWFIPETPYYLLKEGMVDAARNTLIKLNNTKNEEILEERLSQMRSDVRKEMTRSATVQELFTGNRYRRAIFIVVGLKVTQLMSGLHAIQHYLGVIIQESKFEINISTVLIIFGICRFTIGVLSSLLVDRLGRRPLLIYSFFGTGVCFGFVATYFFFNKHPSICSTFNFIPFVGITLANIISVLGFESVAYMVPAELFPLNIKSVAMTSTNIFCGLLNFSSVKSYQPIIDLGGLSGVFWVFATASLIGAVFSYYYMPETKCKSLRQIQIVLQEDIYDENSETLRPTDLNDVENDQLGDGVELKALRTKDEV